jgi:hypothetical protein
MLAHRRANSSASAAACLVRRTKNRLVRQRRFGAHRAPKLAVRGRGRAERCAHRSRRIRRRVLARDRATRNHPPMCGLRTIILMVAVPHLVVDNCEGLLKTRRTFMKAAGRERLSQSSSNVTLVIVRPPVVPRVSPCPSHSFLSAPAAPPTTTCISSKSTVLMKRQLAA